MKRVDHAEASSVFLRSRTHAEFHDQRLWDLRQKRDREAHGIPEWEELRNLASAIKEHTLSHLGDYLEQFDDAHSEIEDRFSGTDDEVVEEIDETAEVVNEDSELPPQQVEARAPMYVVPSTPAPAARRAPKLRSAPGSKGKAAFTLRLDPERHLKLRLACALSGRSAQLLVTDALDQFLDGMPELEAMAEKAKRKG